MALTGLEIGLEGEAQIGKESEKSKKKWRKKYCW
jgi:hypothetical protein